jgi:hypothetical protein
MPKLSDMLGDVGEDDEMESELGPKGAKERAAGDLVSAIKGGDTSAVASAFQRMYDACAMAPPVEDIGEEL